jgi:chlorophyllide a oxygenase
VYAVLSREDGAEFARNNNLEALFHVDDPGPRVPIEKGKLLDVNQALEVVRFDIQYCDWRARQDLLTIMVLHNKVVSEFQEYNPQMFDTQKLVRSLIGG